VAEPAAAGIAGLDGSFEWGPAVTVDAATPGRPDADVVIALGEAGAGARPELRLAGDGVSGAPGASAADAPAAPDTTRLVATTGDGLWSRAPWPVRDELFDLPPPPAGAGVAVVASDEDAAPLLERLAALRIPARAATELTADALAAAAIVAFAPRRDPSGEHRPGARQAAVPAPAFAPLAARRLLLLPRAQITFGLLPGVDHLAASTADELVQLADVLHSHPDALATQLALGRVAAERQRASVVYGRLVEELTATAAPRSAAPGG
jgi:hypothetical protein